MLFIKWYFSLKDLTVQSSPSNIEEKIMKKMPVLFVGHGNPMNALDKNSPFNQNFRQTTQTFEKPKAIL